MTMPIVKNWWTQFRCTHHYVRFHSWPVMGRYDDVDLVCTECGKTVSLTLYGGKALPLLPDK